jgi:hypothetical protein
MTDPTGHQETAMSNTQPPPQLPVAPSSIPTTPVPASVDAARRILAAALDAQLSQGAVPELRLAVAEAYAVLVDVAPPYPPLPPALSPMPAAQAVPKALAHLRTALDEVTSVQDLTRIGLAAIVLRRAGGEAA